MPENKVTPFDTSGNFRRGGSQGYLVQASDEFVIGSTEPAMDGVSNSDRRLGPVRTALFSIPTVIGMGAGAVFGAAGYHTEEVSADYDACEFKDGVIDPFPQVTIPVTHEDPDGDGNCTTLDAPPPTGTPNGNDPTPTTVPHDACPKKNGQPDEFVDVTMPVTHEDPDGDGNCTTKTPPPTGTPNGNDHTPTPKPHNTATPTRTPENTPTPPATATPTRTPENTPTPPTATPTGITEPCVGQLKIVKYHDRNENKQRDALEEPLIFTFNVDEARTQNYPDFSLTTKGDGTAIQTVECGAFSVEELVREGWRETTVDAVTGSKHNVLVGKNEIKEVVIGNVQLKPGETPVSTATATATRPAATPVVPASGDGLANTDLTTKEGRFNFFGFMVPALMGLATSGILIGRNSGRRKQGK